MSITATFNTSRLPNPARMMLAFPAVGLAAVAINLAVRAAARPTPSPTIQPIFIPQHVAPPNFSNLADADRFLAHPPAEPALPVQAPPALEDPTPIERAAAPEAPPETLKLPHMRMGAKRNDPQAVKMLQTILKEQGFGDKLTDPHSHKDGVDGLFGPKTKNALTAFQKQHNLPPTGEVDLETIKLMDKLHPIPKPADHDKLAHATEPTAPEAILPTPPPAHPQQAAPAEVEPVRPVMARPHKMKGFGGPS